MVNKGAGEGGSKVDFYFFLAGTPATRNFLRNEKKILFLARVIAFLNLENTGNYCTHANFAENWL